MKEAMDTETFHTRDSRDVWRRAAERPLRLETVITRNESWERHASTTNVKDKNKVHTDVETENRRGRDGENL